MNILDLKRNSGSPINKIRTAITTCNFASVYWTVNFLCQLKDTKMKSLATLMSFLS